MIRGFSMGALALATCCACAGESKPEFSGDVILITVDALRADYVTPELTPTLTRLAGEGLSFTNARANSSHPLQSVATLLTGLLPTRGGSIGLLEAQPSAEAETLAESFTRARFSTGLVSSQALLRGQGFRRGYADIQVARPGETWPASEVAERAADVLQVTGEGPCFLHVHFADPHEPHVGSEPPSINFAELRSRIAAGASGEELCTPSEIESLRAAYRAEIEAVDEAVAHFLDAVAERSHSNGTLILFTSTCGEEFLEHGYVGHSWTLHEESLRVPLFLHAPEIISPAVDPQPVSLVDVAPTLATLLSLPERRIGFDGDVLVSGGHARSLGSRDILAELVIRERCIMRAVVTDDSKYISTSLWHEPSERPAVSASYMETVRAAAGDTLELPPVFAEPARVFLYDLRNDPLERTSLSAMTRISTSHCRGILEDYRDYCTSHGLAPAAAKAAPAFIESSEAAALEALGYL